jgi:RND family efflux transporter MFP subunit
MRKSYVIAFLILVLSATAAMVWLLPERAPGGEQAPADRSGVPVAVEVSPVERRTIHEIGIYPGTLIPESQFTVAPKVAGRLEKILVDIGDEVRQGELIALLDDGEYVQQVDQARAELDVALAGIRESASELGLRQREYERARTLREKKIVSESELDTAQAQYKTALARKQVAEAQAAQKEAVLRAAQVRLGYTRIRATWMDNSGTRVVSERYVDEGAMLPANSPIVSLVGMDTLTAVIHVIERDYPRIRPGQPVLITTDAHPGKTFAGTIDRVAPVLKEAARQARVEVVVANPERVLTPGMFVRARIQFAQHDDAVVVPVKALVRSNGDTAVFLADAASLRARMVPVRVGVVEGDLAEVASPDLEGLVVTVGQHLLKDGAKIILPADPAGAPGQGPEH